MVIHLAGVSLWGGKSLGLLSQSGILGGVVPILEGCLRFFVAFPSRAVHGFIAVMYWSVCALSPHCSLSSFQLVRVTRGVLRRDQHMFIFLYL